MSDLEPGEPVLVDALVDFIKETGVDPDAIDYEAIVEEGYAREALRGDLPLAMIEFNPVSRQRRNAWDGDDVDPLWLLTPEEFALVPDGSVLVCINGSTSTKGVDNIDLDTRFGLIAHGFLDSQLPPAP
jgi:hypothetical protein